MDFYHSPPNQDKIDTLYVFMSIDEAGRNGLCASFIPGIGATTLVTGYPRLVEPMKTIAAELAAATNKEIGLFEFKRGKQLWSTK